MVGTASLASTLLRMGAETALKPVPPVRASTSPPPNSPSRACRSCRRFAVAVRGIDPTQAVYKELGKDNWKNKRGRRLFQKEIGIRGIRALKLYRRDNGSRRPDIQYVRFALLNHSLIASRRRLAIPQPTAQREEVRHTACPKKKNTKIPMPMPEKEM